MAMASAERGSNLQGLLAVWLDNPREGSHSARSKIGDDGRI